MKTDEFRRSTGRVSPFRLSPTPLPFAGHTPDMTSYIVPREHTMMEEAGGEQLRRCYKCLKDFPLSQYLEDYWWLCRECLENVCRDSFGDYSIVTVSAGWGICVSVSVLGVCWLVSPTGVQGSFPSCNWGLSKSFLFLTIFLASFSSTAKRSLFVEFLLFRTKQ